MALNEVERTAQRFRALDPEGFVMSHLRLGRHTDKTTRNVDDARPVSIQKRVVSTATGSAIVKLGRTTVICGVSAELCEPKVEAPDRGFVIVRTDALAPCTSEFTTQQITLLSQTLHDLIANDSIMTRESLCLYAGQLVWALYCDLQFLDVDAGITDAGVLALVAALSDVRLPTVTLPDEQQNAKQDNQDQQTVTFAKRPQKRSIPFKKLRPTVDLHKTKPLNVRSVVATTMGVIEIEGKTVLVVDPNEEEIAVIGEPVVVVVDGISGSLCSFSRCSWRTVGLHQSIRSSTLQIAQKRSKQLCDLL